MSELRIKKQVHEKVSPQMALLHLRWQQMRLELLQQVSWALNNQESPLSHSSPDKEGYVTV